MIQISCKKCKQKFRREHGKAGPFLHSVSERLLPDSPHVYAFPICSTEFEVTFKVDGSAIVKERGDEAWINKQPSHKAHVYMARTVVVIETVKKGGPAFFTSAYRPGERRLYPEGAPAKEQELFSDELLKDCKSVPLLEQ